MNLNDVRYTIAKFTDKLDAPEEFDVRVNFGHLKNFQVQWGLKNFIALRPFKTILGGQTPPLMLTQGNQYAYGTLPDDYFGLESATVFFSGQEKDVEFLEDADFDNRKKNTIEIPDAENPIGNVQSNFIRFLPKGLQTVNLSYIHTPGKVHFAYKTDRGFIEYDPDNSVELLWDDEQIVNVIMYVLQDLGIEATPEQIKAKQ